MAAVPNLHLAFHLSAITNEPLKLGL